MLQGFMPYISKEETMINTIERTKYKIPSFSARVSTKNRDANDILWLSENKYANIPILRQQQLQSINSNYNLQQLLQPQ